MNTLTQLTNSITNPFKKKKDPAKDLKKTKPAENKQEVQQPRRLNINTETQLEAMDKQVEREQNFKRINVGGFAAREYTNPDGARLVTQDYAAQGKLGDMNQQPSPSSSFSSITVDNTQNRSKAETDPSDLTDPNSEDVQINAIRNQGLRAARDPKVLETLGIEENDIYQSRDDQFRDRADIQNARAGLQAEELDLLEEEEIARLEQMQQQVAGAIGANRASFSQSREGVQSASVNMVRNQFEQEINKQLDARVKRHKHLLKDIGFKRRELEAAKKQGLTDLATILAEDISAAQQELRSNEIQYIDALGRQIDQQLKVDNQMMQKFEFTYGMMAQGQQFSQDQLIGMANEFGLPAEMMLSTYQSLEQVRNDKSLDQQQKQLQTQEILRDSQMRSLGYFTEQQQSAKMFMDMKAAGTINDQQLGELMQIAGIDSRFNPQVQFENELKRIQVSMAKKELNGEPITPQDRLEQFQAIQQLKSLSGSGAAYVAPQSRAGSGITTTFDGGTLNIDFPPDYEEWCGTFANDVMGANVFGDAYSQKVQQIDITTQQVMGDPTLLVPGMAFVMPVHKEDGSKDPYGHVGIVLDKVPDGNGDFDVFVAEANRDGTFYTGKDTGQTNVTKGKSYKLSELDGFVIPPNSQLKAGANNTEGQGGLLNEFKSELKAQGLSGEALEKQAEKMLAESYEALSGDRAKAYNAFLTASEEQNLYSSIIEDLNMESFADSIDFVAREIKNDTLTAEAINSLQLDDTAQRAIMSEMRWLNSILRYESGAAISAEEYSSLGTQYFPRQGDSEATLRDKERSRMLKIKGVEGAMGPAGKRMYRDVMSELEQPAMDADSLIQKYTNQSVQKAADSERESLYSQYGIN